MRRGKQSGSLRRRPAALAVAFLFTGATLAQYPPASQPASQPDVETVPAARQRLARLKAQDRSTEQRALLAALDFAFAVAQSDPRRVAAVVDAVGYQPLPIAGELPEKPDKALRPELLEQQLLALPRADLSALTMDRVDTVSRDGLRERFPAVAGWMLPQDVAIVFRTAAAERVPSWLMHDACVVVRLRGARATVLGGNLLQALAEAAEARAPDAENK